MPEFKEHLRSIRKNHHSTQKQVALAIQVSERNYQDWEYGKTKPGFDALISLADYFDVSLDYLVGRSDDPTRR
jgi:transcriptional regulator with XRE-family HTH domain